MAGARSYSDKTKKRLFSLAGNQCSAPNCNTSVIEPDGTTTYGEICHIAAASPKGLRYDKNMTDKERNGHDNLIVLCKICHAMIDNPDNLSKFPSELLLKWKSDHIEKIKSKLLTEESTGIPNLFWIHDYPMPSNFVGREKYIDDLSQNINKEIIDNNEILNIISLTAVGGTGKTCIVRKAIEDNKDRVLPYKSIIWFSFAESKTDNSTFFFKSILKPIDPDFDSFINSQKEFQEKEEGNFLSNKNLVNRVKQIIAKHPILLIIDNFEIIQETSDENSKVYGQLKKGFKEIYNLFDSILNDGKSMVITTSRLELKKYKVTKGYKSIPLKAMNNSEGAVLLRSLGVNSTEKKLLNFSEVLGNHPLCIKAAGIFINAENITPDDFLNDYLSSAFEGLEEGNKLIEILNFYRNKITDNQEHFLKMMSLHRRYVTKDDFPVLLSADNAFGYSKSEMLNFIVKPLRELNLIEQTVSKNGETHYNSHPLMKFAYKTWFSDTDKKEKYLLLAEAAKPNMVNLDVLSKSEEVQPYFDIIHYYLEAKSYNKAYHFIMDNFKLFMKFKMYDETFKLLEILEKAYNNKDFVIPFSDFNVRNQLSFINKLAYTSDDSKKKIEYNLKAIKIAFEAEDYYSLDQFIHITCGNYLDNGYVQEAINLSEAYTYDRSNIDVVFNSDAIKARIEYAKGNFEEAKSLYNKVYAKICEDSFTEEERHSRTRSIQKFAPILLKLKSYDKAERLLLKDLQYAIDQGFSCCVVSIYPFIIDLYLEINNLEKAKLFRGKYETYCEEYDMEINEHRKLMCALGNYDEVIDLALKDISTDEEEKFDKKEEIEAFIILISAYKGKSMFDVATEYYDKAMQVIEKHQYYPYKQKLIDIYNSI